MQAALPDQLRQPLARSSAPRRAQANAERMGIVFGAPAARLAAIQCRAGATKSGCVVVAMGSPDRSRLRQLHRRFAPRSSREQCSTPPCRSPGCCASRRAVPAGKVRAGPPPRSMPSAVTTSTPGNPPLKSLRNSLRSRSGSHESTISASGCAASASAHASAPPSASRTCQRRPVRICVSRWRKLRSALATSAVRGRMRGCVGQTGKNRHGKAA